MDNSDEADADDLDEKALEPEDAFIDPSLAA